MFFKVGVFVLMVSQDIGDVMMRCTEMSEMLILAKSPRWA